MPTPYRAALTAAALTLFCGLALLVDDGRLDTALAIVGGTMLALTMARTWTLRTGRAFVHGYHAGYHDGTEDRDVTRQPCAVIDLAERQNEQLRSLPA